MKIKRILPNPRMSQAVVYGGVANLAGQVTPDPKVTGVAAQTAAILSRMDELLSSAGTSKDQLLTATIWLKDIATFGEMNKVWEAWLPEGCAPARACVEAKFPFDHVQVEIQISAAVVGTSGSGAEG